MDSFKTSIQQARDNAILAVSVDPQAIVAVVAVKRILLPIDNSGYKETLLSASLNSNVAIHRAHLFWVLQFHASDI